MRLLKLYLPNDFKIFDDNYFDFILHNHVMEHIPGSYIDHLHEFQRILAPGGAMIFSIPGPSMSKLTEEGGEHLSSPEERLAKFGQVDHFKQFGRDLVDFLEASDGMRFQFDQLTDIERVRMSIPKGSNRFLIWRKNQRRQEN
ncbi:MAG: methyltransferase domain-containing protein [Rhizobiaceae bacterium]|jgi:phosphoglycolate phosphatase|nr:methyltransferase domain-containing protein [Rhizobiaceae bacterium]